MKIKHCLTLLTALFVTCVCLLITTTSCADSVLSITSPSNGKSYTTDSSITIKWNKITGAAGYHVSVRNIDNDELVLERAWTTSTSMKISSYIEDPGTYKVWVGAVETKGAASIEAWQDDIHIYVSLSSPDISYPIDESTCSAGESIKLQWDSVTGADGYRYYIKQLSGTPDRSNKDEPYINQWNGRTSSTRRCYTLAGSNIKSGYWYKFVVEAYKSGYDSGWSDWCYVYVEKKTLDKPVISYPVNNNTYTANQSIKLQWSSVSGADGYTYYIKQLQGEPDYVSETEASIAEWSNSTTSTYYTLSASNVKGGYWYKFVVEAYASGANSGWSTWCYVYINQPTLDKPVITSPSTSQTYPANQGITLKWNSVSGAEGYQYYIKQLAGEPDYVSETEASVNDWSSSTTSTSYSLAATNVKGGYWYKFVVRAYASGVESWSEWRYVYIPFDKAVITTPTNWSEVNAGSSITVKWDAVSGADAYKSHIIRLKGEPNTSNDSEQKLALSVDGSYQGEWRIDRGTTRSYTLNGSYVVGGYWYKIVIEAKNTTKGISSWSNWYYVYANETGNLERPVITSPVAYQNYEAGDPISFVWQAVDNATSYKYYIKQLVGEPDNSDNEQAANSWIGEVKASNRRYTLPGKYVQPNTWYKFVVEAKADGYYSGWSRYTYIKIPDRVDWIHYVLPEAMTEISDESFEGNKLLRTFDASKSELSSIGSRAFADCTNLLSINLPITVESIAEDAFTNCPNLTIHCIKGSAAETYANRKKIAVEIHGVAMDTDTVKLSQSNWDVAYAEKAEASVRVTSSGDWSASSNRTWLRVNKTTGSNGTNIVLTADENSTGQKRSGTITFTCGNAKAYLEVSQNNIYASVATEATAKPAPIVTGSWNDSSTITVTLGGTYQLSGYVNVQNGYLGNVSVSVQGGSDRALNNDYAGSVSMINLSEESFFNINTSTNTNFNKAGTYRLVMYAKAYGSTNAIKIGEKTLIVEEPVAVQKPVVSFTRTSATVLNNGTGKFNLTVSTTYTDMFYVELLKNGTPVDIYDDYVKTVQKREYNETDFKNVATLYTTSKKTWPMLSAITIPSGTAEGTYTIRVTAVNNQGKSSAATANLEIVSKIAMQKVEIAGSETINLIISDPNKVLTYTLTAAYSPAEATETTIVWESSDSSVINVVGNGKAATLTALKEGSATITAYNSANRQVKDSVNVIVTKIFGGSYNVLRTFVVDGKEYRQAELLQDYNGVKAKQTDGNYVLFYLDARGRIVTDKSVLEKLFTMQILIDDSFERASNHTGYIENIGILKTNYEAAKRFLVTDEVWSAVGKLGGTAMKLMLQNPLTIADASVDIADRAFNVYVLMAQMHIMKSINDITTELIEETDSLEKSIRNGSKYYYDDVSNLLKAYVYCRGFVETSNNITRPIIDDNLSKYKNNWSLAADNLKKVADGLISSITKWSGETDKKLKTAYYIYKYANDIVSGKINANYIVDEASSFMLDGVGNAKNATKMLTNMRKFGEKLASVSPGSFDYDDSCIQGYYIDDIGNSPFYQNMLKLAQ